MRSAGWPPLLLRRSGVHILPRILPPLRSDQVPRAVRVQEGAELSSGREEQKELPILQAGHLLFNLPLNQPTPYSTQLLLNPPLIQPTSYSTHLLYNPILIQSTSYSTHLLFYPPLIQPCSYSTHLLYNPILIQSTSY